MSDPRHILIVEDMEALAAMAVRILRSEFPTSVIESVPTLAEAKRIIQSEPAPDISFFDLTLKDAGPEHTQAELDAFNERTVVVVMTGANEEVRKTLEERGFEVIYKSPSTFGIDAFLRAILRSLNKRSRAEISAEMSKTQALRERLEARYAPRAA